MSLTLGMNIGSLRAQRYLGQASERRGVALDRISSGLRINRPSDDPAGLSVSSQLEAKSRVLGRARLNVADGNSLLSVADGALSQISSLLVRMAELAEQAASGSLSSQQRKTLDKEYGALDREIRRLVGDTRFNRRTLLTGSKATGELTAKVDDASDLTSFVMSSNERYVAYRVSGGDASTFQINDTLTGESRLVSSSTSGTTLIGIRDDGTLFFTESDLVSFQRLSSYSFSSASITVLSQSLDVDDYRAAVLSADGTTLAFVSETLYTNGGLISQATGVQSGTQRLYTLNLDSGVVSTNGQNLASPITTSQRLVVSADGARLAFRASNGDIFATDYSSNSKELNLITSLNSTLLGITTDGDVVLSSAQDLVGNGNSVNQFFRYSAGTSSLAQLTSLTSSISLASARLSADGSIIAFRSTGNITGENAAGAEQYFRLDLSLNQFEQLTNIGSTISLSSIVLNRDSTAAYGFQSGNLVRLDLSPDDAGVDLEVGFGSAGNIQVNIEAVRSAIRGLGAFTITSAEFARQSLDNNRANIASLAQVRGRIGAGLSRLASADALLSSQRLELTSARSRIIDADLATESAQMIAGEILQRTAASVAAQANQAPALILNLLQS